MKILAIKDPHLRFKFQKPAGRKDTFEDEIESKVSQIIKIIKENKVSSVVFTGDVFDIKSPSKYGIEQVSANISVLKRISSKCPIYSIAGNHDLPFSSYEYKDKSLYQFSVDQGLINDITEPVKLEKYTLYGVDYRQDKSFIFDKIKTMDSSYKNLILVIHEHLVPDEKDRIPFGDCFTYEEITRGLKNHKIIIAGHLHKGYKTETKNGIIIVNNWNLTRLSRDYYSVNGLHTPEVELIDLDSLTTETIKLECRDFEESFIIEDLNKDKETKINIQEFIKKVSEIDGDSGIDLSNLDENIRERIQYYIEKAG